METIMSFIFIIAILYKTNGIDAVIDFFKNMTIIVCHLLKLINITYLTIYGHSILYFLYGTIITYFIVGIILKLFSIPRNKFGKFFGKLAFKIVDQPVAFILDLFTSIILK